MQSQQRYIVAGNEARGCFIRGATGAGCRPDVNRYQTTFLFYLSSLPVLCLFTLFRSLYRRFSLLSTIHFARTSSFTLSYLRGFDTAFPASFFFLSSIPARFSFRFTSLFVSFFFFFFSGEMDERTEKFCSYRSSKRY